MKVVIKYARRDATDREVTRKKVIDLGPRTLRVDWNSAVVYAAKEIKGGERIVAITETGYH